MTQKPTSKGIFAPGGKLVTPDEFAGELTVAYPWNKVSVGGFAGSGKSRTAAEIMKGIYLLLKSRKLLKYDAPLLIIDTERSAQFLVEFFRAAGVPAKTKQTKSLADVQTAFDLASAGHYFGVYIDSTTHILKDFTEAWMQQNKIDKLEMRHYGSINPLWEKEFGQKMVQAETHVVFTGRGTWDYEMTEREEDGRTKRTMERSGVKMQITKDTPFDPNLVIWMNAAQKPGKNGKLTVWREAFVMKDRSGLLDGKTLGNARLGGPTWKDFEPHFLYLLKNYDPTAEVVKTTTVANAVLPEVHEKDPRIERKAIVLDEIKNLIIAVYPTKSDAHTKAKGDLLERHFSTRSWKAVQQIGLEYLEVGKDQLKMDVDAIREAVAAVKGNHVAEIVMEDLP